MSGLTVPTKPNHDGLGLPGVSNYGKSESSDIMHLAAIAVATINTLAAWEIAKDQYELANKYLALSQKARQEYNTTYKPYEDKEIAEAAALEDYIKKYKTSTAKARGAVLGATADEWLRVATCAGRYCTGVTANKMADLANKEHMALMDASIRAIRYEDAYWDAINEINNSRLNTAINRGRDILYSTLSFGNLSAGIYSNLGGQAAVGASGAMGYLGYASARGLPREQYRAPVIRDDMMVEQPQQRITINDSPSPYITPAPKRLRINN